jgi:hypothetical protein
MPPVGFELATPAGERPQTYALDRAATGTGASYNRDVILSDNCGSLLPVCSYLIKFSSSMNKVLDATLCLRTEGNHLERVI